MRRRRRQQQQTSQRLAHSEDIKIVSICLPLHLNLFLRLSVSVSVSVSPVLYRVSSVGDDLIWSNCCSTCLACLSCSSICLRLRIPIPIRCLLRLFAVCSLASCRIELNRQIQSLACCSFHSQPLKVVLFVD